MKKSEIFRRILKRLLHLKQNVFLLCLMFSIRTIISFIYPILIRGITDKGMVYKNMSIITAYAVAMFILLLSEQVIGIWQIKIGLKIKHNFQKSLFSDVFEKLLSLNILYLNRKSETELIDELTTDINNIGMVADDGLIDIINYLLKMVSGVLGLFVIDKRLASVVLLLIPIKWYLVTKTSKKKEIYMKQYIEYTRKFADWFGDIMKGIREIKLWNMYKIVKNKFNEKQENIIESNVKFSMMDCYNSSGDTIINAILTSGLYLMGGWMVCNSQLSIGSIVAFITYSSYVTGPISIVFNLKYLFAGIYPSAQRLYQFMELEEEVGDAGMELHKFENIEFKNVSYGYDGEKVLNQINAKISKGEKIAIIGDNGSGKTTFINLLLRFIKPISGEITLDGISIQDLNLNEYRDLFSVVSQDIYLFHDTVLNNINMGNHCSTEIIEMTCKNINLDNFLNGLPDGIDGMIEKNGNNMSGGERRKVAIARALVKDAPIIILDEANSNLDVESNKYLHHLLDNNFLDKTVIMITHNYDYLERMDMVYRLEDGKLICTHT